MRKRASLLLLLCLTALGGASSARAAPVEIPFGWNNRKLQDLVDLRYGKNHIDVTRDYIGARSGDIDPWFWVGDLTDAVGVRVLRRDADCDLLGWYEESGNQARIPDGGGRLFSGPSLPYEEAVVRLPGLRNRFGFYLDATLPTVNPPPLGPGFTAAPTKRFFTNRKLNDHGPLGMGASHAPFDGDVQAVVYDVSRWSGSQTWLVCFEAQDTGGSPVADNREDGDDDRLTETTIGQPKHEDGGDDDSHTNSDPQPPAYDFYDLVFEVRADGATRVHPLTFGALKRLYR